MGHQERKEHNQAHERDLSWEPVILDAEQIPHALRLLVAKTLGHRTIQVKVPIDSPEDVSGLMEMVKVKWEFFEDGQR